MLQVPNAYIDKRFIRKPFQNMDSNLKVNMALEYDNRRQEQNWL